MIDKRYCFCRVEAAKNRSREFCHAYHFANKSLTSRG